VNSKNMLWFRVMKILCCYAVIGHTCCFPERKQGYWESVPNDLKPNFSIFSLLKDKMVPVVCSVVYHLGGGVGGGGFVG
jgi:hypothetical protein